MLPAVLAITHTLIGSIFSGLAVKGLNVYSLELLSFALQNNFVPGPGWVKGPVA